MTYNLHPIVVHFPIALLFLYSVLKILPMKKFFPKVSWEDVESTLLLFGFLGILIAIPTGQIAKHLSTPNRKLVHEHSNFAIITAWLYGILLAGEVLAFINRRITVRINIKPLTSLLVFVENILRNPVLSKLLALAGLICLFITGLLGGAMVYGLTADPMTPFVLKMLGITL